MSLTMTTANTKLLPLDYALGNNDIFASLNRYTKGGQVSAGETDDDDDVPKADIYIKTKKKGSGKKKGGKKSGSKKKKKGGKKKK